MHTYTCKNIRAYTYMYIHKNIHSHTGINMLTHNIQKLAYIYMKINIFNIHISTNIHIHTHANTFAHTSLYEKAKRIMVSMIDTF